MLAGRLDHYRGRPDALVLALPRGGVPVAYEAATALDAELDVLLVRKLGVPGRDEVAMGAIASGGVVVLNEDIIRGLNISPEAVRQMAEREGRELLRRQRMYRGDRPMPDIEDRAVILVDDGLATGASARAAIQALRRMRPGRIVVAVPAAPESTVRDLMRAASRGPAGPARRGGRGGHGPHPGRGPRRRGRRTSGRRAAEPGGGRALRAHRRGVAWRGRDRGAAAGHAAPCAGVHAWRDGLLAEADLFYAQRHAIVVRNAAAYYRSMFSGRVSSWNLRDRHMVDTLDALAEHLGKRRGEPAKIVAWEYDSHLGDARATESAMRGELNVGRLVREGHPDDCRLLGFTTYTGTVTAADDWGAPAARKRVRPALAESVEELFHEGGL
ncbi:erythromycin esterase family protein [Streptomyces rhizosphaericus]|uniref:erythromycin esterase family protein n=1 Tax=Streptomyces rhizosphaericus TaxID=114699 RepID=UPI002892C823|nr:erythromycin esterase family protein [Streptomyces rhizosphaericus]